MSAGLIVRIGGVEAVCRPSGALWVEGPGALIVADLHFEKGSFFAKHGQMLPPYDTADTLARLEAEIEALTPAVVICLGDSFHDAEGEARLARTRFPDSAPGEALSDPWAYGTDVAYLRGLVDYWREGFDWRTEEAALNAFPQFRVPIDGIDLHYLHVEGKGDNPMPLLLLHGWPGSVFEFLDIIPRLTDPARFGGDSRDAFTVIAPSLPGYGLSFKPGQKRYGVPEMADCVAALMHDVLGFPRFAAQGGDWGAAVTSRLGYAHAEKMIGIHLNLWAAAGREAAAIRPRLLAMRCFTQQHPHDRVQSPVAAAGKGKQHRSADDTAVPLACPAIQLGEPAVIGQLVVVKKRDPPATRLANSSIASRHDAFRGLMNAAYWVR